MPNPTFNSNSLTTTLLLLFVLLLGLFPGLFHYLWATPLYLCSIALSPSQPTRPPIPVVLETHNTNTMSWFQKTITLPSKSRGCYLVTNDIVSALPELKQYKIGTVNLFLQHTSAALSLNENYDSDVRDDMSTALDRIVEEDKKNKGLYKHDAEGSDDMPVSCDWSSPEPSSIQRGPSLIC